MIEYRTSNILKYDSCPYQYYRDIVLGEERVSELMSFGKAVHLAIQLVIEKALTIVDAASEAVKETAITDGYCHEVSLVRWMTKIAIQQIAKTPQSPDDPPAMDVKSVEVIIRQPLDNNPLSPIIKGTIDVVTPDYIWDWKTGWGTCSNPMQLKVYAWLKSKAGTPVRGAGFIYLRKQQVKWFTITDQDLVEAETWLNKTVQAMEEAGENLMLWNVPEGAYPAKANSNCKTCPYITECQKKSVDGVSTYSKEEEPEPNIPVMNEYEETIEPLPDSSKADNFIPDTLSSHDEAILLANETIRLEGLIDVMKDKLKAYVKSTGQKVVTGNKVFDFVESISWNFSSEQTKLMSSEIITLGLNPWHYMEFPATSRTKFFKELDYDKDAQRAFLERFGQSKTTKSFKCVAVK